MAATYQMFAGCLLDLAMLRCTMGLNGDMEEVRDRPLRGQSLRPTTGKERTDQPQDL